MPFRIARSLMWAACLTSLAVSCGESDDSSRERSLEATIAALQTTVPAGSPTTSSTAAAKSDPTADVTSQGSAETKAQDAVRRFTQAMADWDTVEMINLTCAADRDDVEAGLSLAAAFIGFGGSIGIDTPRGELRDVTYSAALVNSSEATVLVTGRILYGPPLGSVDITEVSKVRLEEGRWCVAGDGDAPETRSPIGNYDDRPPIIGEVAPSFGLETINGTATGLAAQRGSPVWIYFWATWCRPCEAEIERVQHLANEMKSAGLVVLLVNEEEDRTTLLPWLASHAVTLDVLLDVTGEIYDQYRLQGLPDSVFVRADGTIAVVHYGSLAEDRARAFLGEIGLP